MASYCVKWNERAPEGWVLSVTPCYELRKSRGTFIELRCNDQMIAFPKDWNEADRMLDCILAEQDRTTP